MRAITTGILLLLLATIAIVATGQARSHPRPAFSNSQTSAPAYRATAAGLQLITEPQAGNAPFLALIAGARHTVTLTMYEFEDPAIEHALAAAAARGVNVRVLLNGGYYNEHDHTNEPAYSYLADHRVRVRYSPTYFALTHQKTLTVDGEVAVIMTLNFDGSYATTRDYAVIDRQPADVHAILATFNADYADRQTNPSDGTGDLVWSPGAAGAFLRLIDGARRSIALENEEMDYTPVTDALCSAARRGVQVRIVMTYESDWASAFSRLSGCGAHIHLYYGQRYYIHAKLLLLDGDQALLGSQNLSTSSLDYNRELSIDLRSRPVIAQLAAAFDGDYAGGALSTSNLYRRRASHEAVIRVA